MPFMELNLIEKTRLELASNGKKILDLSSGLVRSTLIQFPTEILKKGFQKFLENPRYVPDSKGILKARNAVAKFYAKRDCKINPEQILLTSGTSESYFEIFKLLAEPGDEILFPNPSYPLFQHLADLAHIQINWYQLDEEKSWQPDFQNLQSRISPKTKAIVLISPNNPTGSVLSENSLLKIAEISQKYHLPVISDEVFSEMMFEGKKFPRLASVAKEITVFTLNGVSKTYALPGLKLSWIAVSGPKASEISEKLSYLTDTFLACNQMSQEMLTNIISGGKNFIQKQRNYLEKNRDTAMEIFSLFNDKFTAKKGIKITFHRPEAGPYLFAKIHGLNLTDEKFVVELMKSSGIFVHPGYFYDYDRALHILISFAMEPKKLKTALNKIVKFCGAQP